MICFRDRFTRIKFAAKYIDLFYVNLIYLFILAVRKKKIFQKILKLIQPRLYFLRILKCILPYKN
jgi:hypothetical protein